MNCAECQELLKPYLAHELDPMTSAKIEIHLENCPNCAGLYRKAKKPVPPPQEEAKEAAPDDPPQRPETPAATPSTASVILERGHRLLPKTPRQFAIALGIAALAAVILTVKLMPSPAPGPEIIDRLESAHIRSLMANHLIDVAATDPGKLNAWFAARLDFTPPVVDLDSQGFPLMGGRVDYVADHRAAALIYRHGDHIINLFIWTGRLDDDGATTAGGKYNQAAWSAGGLVFHAVSDLDSNSLQDFASRYRAATP